MLAVAVLLVAGWPSSALALGPQDGPESGGATVVAKAVGGGAEFSCATSPTGVAYCSYHGPVRITYVNDNQLILLYPDVAVTPTLIQTEVEASGYETYWGVDISAFFAFAAEIPLDTDPDYRRKAEFADKFYAMLLAAELSDRYVSVQMRSGHFGYLRIDRAWLD